MKKFHKVLAASMAAALSLSALSACSSSSDSASSSQASAPAVSTESAPAASTAEAASTQEQAADTGGLDPALLESAGLEYVDGNYKFTETKDITVEVYDRGQDNGKTIPEDNYWTDFIKKGMLEDHNVNVTFQAVPRWTEDTEINNLLASGTAPDVCVTYNYASIQQYANMGGVIDLSTYVEDYKPALSNLWGLLKETNMYYDKDPDTGSLWALEAYLANNAQINTFIREDWLNTLNLEMPTNLEEFENCLIAFRDNAETLLGADADKMVPFSTSYDVAWRAYNLLSSYIPSDITDKDIYIYGFDDRHFSFPYVKEGVRVLNKWYNEGLIWKDFPLYGEGDTTEDNLIKSGYVGAWEQNWDMPYRDGDNSVTTSLHNLVGPDANYIAIEPYLDDTGVPKKWIKGTVDRKLFLPSSNDEPVASLLYLDWISKFENRLYLQIGDEGVNHTTQPDGSYVLMGATGDQIMNSSQNIDYTITINGIQIDGNEEATNETRALAYSNVDTKYVVRSLEVNFHDSFVTPTFHFPQVVEEEGMSTPLADKRNVLLADAVTCPVDQFDTVWDAGYADYLSSGMQKIIDARTAMWTSKYGDATALPAEE
jgi:putative aldouronate transport system substrate-binding protein